MLVCLNVLRLRYFALLVVDTLDRKEGKKSWLREADRGRKMEPENENKDSRRKKRRKKVINHITGGMKVRRKIR